jgi:hypothetical protein
MKTIGIHILGTGERLRVIGRWGKIKFIDFIVSTEIPYHSDEK